MRRVLKWAGRGLAALVLLALFAAWAAYFVLRNTVPPFTGTLTAAGLSAPVEVVRDQDGVPHILGQSLEDLHFALGFTHAQDRLWQMELQRRTGQGRLSELFGERTLKTDVFLRTLDLWGHAQRSVDALPEEGRRQLEAYARGVNAHLQRRTGLLEPRLPIEFLLLRHAPEPWTAADCVVTVKLMALQLSNNLGQEMLRLALSAQGLGPVEIADLMPPDAEVPPPPLPELASLYPIRRAAPTRQAAAMPIVDVLLGEGASNNWVVSGARTRSGKPLLANDPHLRLSAPAIWYLAHMRLQPPGAAATNVAGASLPGVPSIVIGRTDRVAWGFTNTGSDVQDVFIEKVNPDNPREYRTPDGWRPFETQQVTVAVRGGEPHVFERRRTRHGPVLPGFFRGIEGLLAPGHVGALAWTALSDDDTTIAAGLINQTTQTVDDYIAQMRHYIVPMQSMVVADTGGNIALIAPGRVPVRDPANLVAGRAPVPGWDATYDWKGFLAFDQLPQVKNPAAGAIGTANARIVPPDFPHLITHDWDAPFRAQRIGKLIIDRTEPHDIDSMREAQADVLSPAVQRLQTLMIAIAQGGAGVDNGVLDQLTAWDGRQNVEAPEPLIYAAWVREALRGIYADDLGFAFDAYFDGRSAALIRLLEGRAGGRDWCDDRRTPARESCAQVLADALKRALADLEQRYGADRKAWRWGQAHVALSEHRPFGLVSGLAPYFNVGVPSPGGDETLNRGKMEYGEAQPLANRHASSFRAIYDFADLDKSLYMQTTGQSGNPLSRHYRSLADRWAAVEYIEIPTQPERIRREAVGTWTLSPQR